MGLGENINTLADCPAKVVGSSILLVNPRLRRNAYPPDDASPIALLSNQADRERPSAKRAHVRLPVNEKKYGRQLANG